MKGVKILAQDREQFNDKENFSVETLAKSIFTVNRHAKTAPEPKNLYFLKHEALKKMLTEGKAVKKGLHFSPNPKFSQQQSDVLVKCGRFTFHIPPTKADFQQLPHLGKLDESTRNPRVRQSLGSAKKILHNYLGIKHEDKHDKNIRKQNYRHRRNSSTVFKPLGESYLGTRY